MDAATHLNGVILLRMTRLAKSTPDSSISSTPQRDTGIPQWLAARCPARPRTSPTTMARPVMRSVSVKRRRATPPPRRPRALRRPNSRTRSITAMRKVLAMAKATIAKMTTR